MVTNRKCLSCATNYSYCPNCAGADRVAPAWKAEFCSEECKDLWFTATKFNMNMISKDEAKDIISSLNLKPIDNYVSCVQRDYNKIMTEEKKTRKNQKKIAPLVEVEPIVEIEQPAVAEQVVTEPESHEVVLKENE